MNIEVDLETLEKCPDSFVLAVNDTMNVLAGKWKLPIIASLLFGKKRFKELGRDVTKITPRMLSKELRDLEINGIVKRTVYNTVPVTVEYELTTSGHSFKKVLDVMLQWGLEHRKETIGKAIGTGHK
jgi:DNA-binding HxlR family transcriptional regulator